MSKKPKKSGGVGGIYGFGLTWLLLSFVLPLYKGWAILLTCLLSGVVAYFIGKMSAKKQSKKENELKKQTAAKAQPEQAKKSYGPEIDAVLAEGNRALKEMGRLYMSIKDPDIRVKINELMRITDKIAQDAIEDPSDLPQIRKFMDYYLPTTIKLLNTYDRMSAQGIEGENLNKSMKSIIEMLDEAIEAYKKQLDAMFANQALDIETDIEVLNTMLTREGLSGGKDFNIQETN